MADCIFCRIARGEVPAAFLYEDDRVVAFADISPQAPVHVLVVPRRHIASVAALKADDAALAGHMVMVTQKLAGELGVAASGYRLVANAGPDSGQLVPHLHFHLLGGRPLGACLG